jgi:hypothetical protein
VLPPPLPASLKMVGFTLFTRHEGPKESRGIALLCFKTSALEGGERSASHPGRFLPPVKTRYPSYGRLRGLQVRSGQVRKISPPPGFDWGQLNRRKMRTYAALFVSDLLNRKSGDTMYLRNVPENMLLIKYYTEPQNLCPSREWISKLLVVIETFSVLR